MRSPKDAGRWRQSCSACTPRRCRSSSRACSVGAAVGFPPRSVACPDEVLVPDDEFASVLLPALAVAERSGALRIRLVPFHRPRRGGQAVDDARRDQPRPLPPTG